MTATKKLAKKTTAIKHYEEIRALSERIDRLELLLCAVISTHLQATKVDVQIDDLPLGRSLFETLKGKVLTLEVKKPNVTK